MIKYDAMLRAIAECHSVDEAKEIRNKAAALKEYMRQAGNYTAERQAAEIRIRAERQAGTITREMETRPGARTDQQPRTDAIQGSTKQKQLQAAGISRRQASEWEKLAAIPGEQFEAAMAQAEMPSTTGIIAMTAAPTAAPVSKPAMKLWSWLRAFQSDGYLDRDPDQLLQTMSDEMLDDVHALAPKIAAWFGHIGEPRNASDPAAGRH